MILERPDAKARHIIQCIGSSSIQKGKDFVAKHCPKTSPTIYGSYEEVYADNNVDCVYIGTPHGFHKKNCLDAIAAGKHILCEKAFTINAREAREVIDAARKKGTYLHEAMWLRHRPLVNDLRKLLFEDQIIGDVYRMRADFGLDIDVPNLPSTSRYKDLRLGAGTLLDIGIYPLTWALLTLDPGTPLKSEVPGIQAVQTHIDGVEVTSSVVLKYRSSGRQAMVSSTTMGYGDPNIIGRIDGTKGHIDIEGPGPSVPSSFTVYSKVQRGTKQEGKKHDYPEIGRGFYYEADNTALDIAAGRTESQVMPLAETLRVMEYMDEIRRQGGTVYPQDSEK